jgi:hypothetical protein
VQQCVRLCVAVCGSVWQCARQCVVVRSTYIYIYSKLLTIYIYIYIGMLWPDLSCNTSLPIISYTGCRGQTAPSCTTSLTMYISIRDTSRPSPTTCRSVLFHIRAVEATQPPPAPRLLKYTFICCGLPSSATRCSVVCHIRQRAVEARLSSPAPHRSPWISVCSSVWQCVAAYIHKVAHNKFWYVPLWGGGTKPYIPRMLILTQINMSYIDMNCFELI